jgi:hypothetical protein
MPVTWCASSLEKPFDFSGFPRHDPANRSRSQAFTGFASHLPVFRRQTFWRSLDDLRKVTGRTGLRITALAAVSVPTDLSTRRDRRSATDRELPPGAFPFGRPSASVRSRPVCKAPDVPCGISRCLCAAGSVRGSRPLRVISAERPTPLKNPPIFPTAFQAVASPELQRTCLKIQSLSVALWSSKHNNLNSEPFTIRNYSD